MSILIRGMEVPKKPGAYSMKIRLFVREDGTASIWGLEEYIPHEPLDVIPVPPHGRLIDADALVDAIQANIDMWKGAGCDVHSYESVIDNYILDAPTIIQAEPFNNLSKPRKDDDDFPICTKASHASLGIYKKAEEGE